MMYLESESHDPYFNLALEQHVFDSLDRSREYFMLWQNDNTIVVGKHQNTAEEINLPFVEASGISVARRLSGGGAVYHDMGNLNFTYIVDAREGGTLDLRYFCEPVVKALSALGVDAEVSGRNDITVDGRKFSGNAQYRKEGRVMHHGTIMFDSNLDTVSKALRVSASKIESKGIKSVRSRVTNLKPYMPEGVTLEKFKALLLKYMFEGVELFRYNLSETDLGAVERLRSEQYSTWEWNFGKSPPYTAKCSRRVEGCGTVEILMRVEKGLVAGIQFYGDFFSVDDPADLEFRFLGKRANKEGYAEALSDIDVGRYFTNLRTDELLDILACAGDGAR